MLYHLRASHLSPDHHRYLHHQTHLNPSHRHLQPSHSAAAASRLLAVAHNYPSLLNADDQTTKPLRPLTSSSQTQPQLPVSNARLQSLCRLLDACSAPSDIKSLRLLHNDVLRLNLESHVHIAVALSGAYYRCGAPDVAHQLFDRMPHKDVVRWTVVISSCCKGGQFDKALGYFRAMLERGIAPDEIALVSILSAVVRCGRLLHGLEVHGHLVRKFSRLRKATVTSLVNLYAKLGRMDYATRIANGKVRKNVVATTALMMGLIHMDDVHSALMIYRKMVDTGIEPTQKTTSCLIRAVSAMGFLRLGTQIHGYVIKKQFDLDDHLLSCLIDMYSVCRAPTQLCRQLFDQMLVKDVVLWTAMISAYRRRGEGHASLQLFDDMQAAGVVPDSVAFTAILSACSSSGLLLEGLRHFDSMVIDYGIRPREEHYAYVKGMLTKDGKLEEAYAAIGGMALRSDRGIWEAFLGACKVHGNMSLPWAVGRLDAGNYNWR